mmetsp:Transcript_3931/g.14501  ORF Transcript_3931/g.14501 Transcript_3931/m.14501 type:complete len:341 (-) Transcript_3931:48-1070(-)
MGCFSSKPVDATPAPAPAPAPVAPVATAPDLEKAAAPVPPPPVEPTPPSPSKKQKSPEEVENELRLKNVFHLFAGMDTTKSGSVGVNALAVAMQNLPVLGTRLCENLGLEEGAVDEDVEDASEAYKSLASKILDAWEKDLATPGFIKPHELERLITGPSNVPKIGEYNKLPDFVERDRLHQLKGAAARAETRTEDAGGFVGLIDATEAKTIANRSVTKQRIELEMKQFIESDPELFGHGAAFGWADSPLKKEREAYLLKIEMELKEEGMLNKVGEDFAGLTNEEAAAQIESIKLGGVEVSIEGEETRKTKTMPDRLAKRLEEDPRKPPAYWENRLSNGTP